MSAIILIIISLAVMSYNSIYQIRIKNSILMKYLYAIILTDFINEIQIKSVKPIYIPKKTIFQLSIKRLQFFNWINKY